jgi:hypothetical protein
MNAVATERLGSKLSIASIAGGNYSGVICNAILKNSAQFYIEQPSASVVLYVQSARKIMPQVATNMPFGNVCIANNLITITINSLITLKLATALSVIIEPDEDAYIARCVDLPVFGLADDAIEAIDSLKREIESLYYDLMEDDKFSLKWLDYKKFLLNIVVTNK